MRITASNLLDFYRQLLHREGLSLKYDLCNRWPPSLIDDIIFHFTRTIKHSRLRGMFCPILTKTSNQSAGNKICNFFIPRISKDLSRFRIIACDGPGYPDKTLIRISDGLRIPLEVKATKEWNHSDTNRRVLTSASNKLRENFTWPFYHLLIHLVYSLKNQRSEIKCIRLDFLEPTTLVQIRLEASVNHQSLSKGNHTSRSFGL